MATFSELLASGDVTVSHIRANLYKFEYNIYSSDDGSLLPVKRIVRLRRRELLEEKSNLIQEKGEQITVYNAKIDDVDAMIAAIDAL